MREIIIRILFFSLFLSKTIPGQSQMLSFGQELEMTIMEGTDFSFDQLVLIPSKSYSIRNNFLSLTKTKLFKEGKSVSRTYMYEQIPSFFSGKILMAFENSEEAGYQIQILDNLKWYALDTKASISSNRFLEGNLISGRIARAITLGKRDAGDDFEILTNPVENKRLKIIVHNAGEFQVISNDGKLLFRKKLSQGFHEFDMGSYSNSSYMLTSGITSRKFIL